MRREDEVQVDGRVGAPPGVATTAGRDPRTARLLVTTSFAHFLNDGVVFFVPVVGDLLAENHHTSTVVVTAMLTIFYVTSAGTGVVVGLLADRIGRRAPLISLGIAVLGMSLLGFYAALSLAGISSDLLVLLAAVVAGAGSSFYHPLGGSVLQLGVPARSRGMALGVNGAFGSLGRAAYPALFFVVTLLGISKPTTAALFGGLSLLAAVILLLSLPADGGRPTGAVPAAASHESLARDVGSRQGNEVPERPRARGEAREGGLRALLTRSVVALMTIAFFRSLAFIGIVSWIPIYLSAQRHVGVSTTLGYTVTVMYAGGIVGQPLFGVLTDHLDKRLVLAVDSLGSAGGIFLFLSTSGDGASALLALAVFGLFTFSGFPLLLSLVADYVPKESSTTGNALVWGIGSTGGQALGPLVVGLMTAGSDSHLGVAFGVLGVVAAATVLGTPLLGKVTRSSHVALFG